MPRWFLPDLLSMLALLGSSLSEVQVTKDIKGVVQGVDTVNGTIRVIQPAAPRAERIKTFNLARPDLPVDDADGKPLKLRDILPDQAVILKLANDDVIAIRKAAPFLFGTLKAVNMPERTVVLKTQIGDRTVSISTETKVIEDKQPTEFKDLKPGNPTLLLFSEDHKTVAVMRTGKNVYPSSRLVFHLGYLMDIDPGKHTLQILGNTTAGDTFHLHDLAFARDPSCTFLFHGKPHRNAAIEEVARGLRVNYWTDHATRKVVHLEVEMPILAKRPVKAIDPGKRRILLDDPEGEMAFVLSPHVKVLTDKGPGQLQDIQPQAMVSCGLAADRKTVEVVEIFARAAP